MENAIQISGARAGGLKDISMELPLGKIICFTGRSSNGRRAMALDVLFAESRRRYMQALSPVEREGISGVGKVDLDSISGLPPAIYLGGPRSSRTVGDYLQVQGLLLQLAIDNGQMHCGDCGGICRGYEVSDVESQLAQSLPNCRCLILAPLLLRENVEWSSVCRELAQAGFTRLMIDDEIIRLDGDRSDPVSAADIFVVVDRLVPVETGSVRFLEAVRLSRSISSGLTVVMDVETGVKLDFNQQPTCGDCRRRYEEQSSVDFSNPSVLHTITLFGQPFELLQSGMIGEVRGLFLDGGQELSLQSRIVTVLTEAGDLGLDHLPLNRRLDALANGEWQRLQLVACITSGLTGILYIFDSFGNQVGLDYLPKVMDRLRHLVDMGNTALLLDHSTAVAERADQIWLFADGYAKLALTEKLTSKRLPRVAQYTEREMLAIRGQGPLGLLDLELPQGALICLHGPSGCGKSRILHELLPGVLKRKATTYAVSGVGRNNRVVAVGAPASQKTLIAELGIFQSIAALFAESAAAKAQGWGVVAFMLDKPGGRCPSCEGVGQRHFDLEFLEDVSFICETCEGSRFRREVREITLRGISISDVLAMSIERAQRHFARDTKIKPRLEAAARCGLGYLALGLEVGRLERGEWLRLRLAGEATRNIQRSWYLVDEPSSGDHPEDVTQMASALRGLVERGATVVVADSHPEIMAEADRTVDLSLE